MIAAIRAAPGYLPELALVAGVGEGRSARVVGQIMVSATVLERPNAAPTPVLLLSPLGVDPGHQGQGIGAALTRRAVAIADERPEPVTVVQGHPDYYPRFGFVRGRTIGILPPEHLGPIDRAWMARTGPKWTPAIRGRVVYPPHFRDLH